MDQLSGKSCKNIRRWFPGFSCCTSTSYFIQGACDVLALCQILKSVQQFVISELGHLVALFVIKP